MQTMDPTRVAEICLGIVCARLLIFAATSILGKIKHR
jgi:hypothetical protein